jgi:RNA polymerase primary sigma factor
MSISEEHVRYVRAIARHYSGLGLDLDDLVQEGSLGLLAAARSFDASRGVPFTAYARSPIRQAICRALTANSRVATTACDEHELPPADTPDPLDRLCDDEARTLVRQALAGLDPRWRQVMVLRHGLIDDHPRSLAQIGRAMGITRGRVREIEARAMCRLATEPRLVALGTALGADRRIVPRVTAQDLPPAT